MQQRLRAKQATLKDLHHLFYREYCPCVRTNTIQQKGYFAVRPRQTIMVPIEGANSEILGAKALYVFSIARVSQEIPSTFGNPRFLPAGTAQIMRVTKG